MDQKSVNSRSNRFVILNFKLGLNDKLYTSVRLNIIKDLCCDVVLGQEFQSRHIKVTMEYGGQLPELVKEGTGACFAIEAANIAEPTLFPKISIKCKPIATKSRCFNEEGSDFIVMEIGKLQKDGIIEPSMSLWHAQVIVVKDETKKKQKRLCVDYSQTINICTELDVFPLPKISNLVTNLAMYKYFSSFDLKSAYHQIRLKQSDRKYTAFEANGQLFEFTCLPFEVWGPCFPTCNELNCKWGKSKIHSPILTM